VLYSTIAKNRLDGGESTQLRITKVPLREVTFLGTGLPFASSLIRNLLILRGEGERFRTNVIALRDFDKLKIATGCDEGLTRRTTVHHHRRFLGQTKILAHLHRALQFLTPESDLVVWDT
jgi:hypothetical protein